MHSTYEKALRIALDNPNKDDGKEVLTLLDEGVEKDDERAIYARAVCYSNGTYNSEIDETRSKSLLLELSSSNVPEALFDLAVSYDYGQGMKEDKFAAFEHYLMAATLGHTEACFQVSEFFREGSEVTHSERLQKFWLKRSKKKKAEISPPDRVWLR